MLLLFAGKACAHSVTLIGDSYEIHHTWTYGERQWSCTLHIAADLYHFDQGLSHIGDDFVHYVLSDHDRGIVQELVRSFREGGAQCDYSDTDNVLNVIHFVQSLRYVADAESKGETDYVRFPVETLVDGIGDCEDMAILAASILYEMGYGVLLVCLPDHLAIAVRCEDGHEGSYYLYRGLPYYYLEVTNTGWKIGQIPDEFKNAQATLIPLVYQPKVRLERCGYHYDAYSSLVKSVDFKVQCSVENLGPGTTDRLRLHVLFVSGEWIVAQRVFDLDDLFSEVDETHGSLLIVFW